MPVNPQRVLQELENCISRHILALRDIELFKLPDDSKRAIAEVAGATFGPIDGCADVLASPSQYADLLSRWLGAPAGSNLLDAIDRKEECVPVPIHRPRMNEY